jgi:NAD(P)-dependent dehydrogenase (short-subunit alcohol dehydrogenase family)
VGADLSGRRVLVVGASSGIGRVIGQECVRAGAEVVFSARRRDKLEQAVEEADGGTVVTGDVRRAEDCRRVVADAAASLGGLDLVVYASGLSPLVMTEDQTSEGWRELFETNAVGALMVMTAAVPIVGPDGLIAYLSTDSIGAPYHGLVPYSATKAALDEGVRGLRMEHPDIRFCRVAVGPTTGTEIALDHDFDLMVRLLPEWLRNARGFERQMEVGDVGALIVEVLASALAHPAIEVEEIMIKPPGGTLPWGTPVEVLVENIRAFKSAGS